MIRKILELLPQEYRLGCFKMAALVPVKAVLDLVGVAALIPVMLLVLEPGRLPFPAWTVLGGIVGVLIIKTVLSILITRFNIRYLMGLYRSLSSRAFASLFAKGLVYVKNNNSARMTFNVTGVCYNFVMCYLGGWMNLIGEIAFVLALFAGMMAYSMRATLLSVCAFVPGVLIYLFAVRKPLRQMGRRENELRREQTRIVNETFRGYSEVRVNDAFPMIMDRFTHGLEEISTFRLRGSLIQGIPSYLLELSVVVLVAVLTLITLPEGSGTDGAVFLGICTVVMIKLLPAVRNILGCMSSITATKYTQEILGDMTTVPDKETRMEDVKPIPFKEKISLKSVTFAFDEDSAPVFRNFDLEIPKGCRLGVRGRTGAGKTTLFNILLGLYTPQEGGLYVDDERITPENLEQWHKIIGYVPQDVFITDSTIIQNVALGCDLDRIDRDKVIRALDKASLMDFVNNLPDGIDTRIGEMGSKMSGGQRQRLGIARALYKDASVLFFDEATSSLDSQTESQVNKAVESLSSSDNSLTIIVISHRESTLEFCDRILAL